MTTLTIGKRLIPIEQIAFVEPFDPSINPKIQTDKPFKSRVVLLDRESVLAEFEALDFAEQHRFRWVMEDQTATNPGVHFGVETFTPAADFQPKKAYRSRLVWRDADGNTQSKLLVAEPDVLLAVSIRGESVSAEEGETPHLPPPSSRVRRRKTSLKQILPEPG